MTSMELLEDIVSPFTDLIHTPSSHCPIFLFFIFFTGGGDDLNGAARRHRLARRRREGAHGRAQRNGDQKDGTPPGYRGRRRGQALDLYN